MTVIALTLASLLSGAADPPEIAQVFPDFADARGFTHVITGESFDPAATEVWFWSPPSDEQTIRAAMAQLA
ncbi:MAG: hypothetical protein ACYTG0_28955 [Planctomycetota bacterium]|jgi:hypothetical protein